MLGSIDYIDSIWATLVVDRSSKSSLRVNVRALANYRRVRARRFIVHDRKLNR